MSTPSPRAAKLLVIDDEPGVRFVVTEILGDRGYEVVEATDGKSGLAAFRQAFDVDVMIVDLTLPDMSGEAVVTTARLQRPDIGVIFVTGRTTNDVTYPLDSRTRVMVKPFTIMELIAAIEDVLQVTGNPGVA